MNSGLEKIVIKNGKIEEVILDGIRIRVCVSNIQIEDLEIIMTVRSVINFAGIGGSLIVEGTIKNCQIVRCATA